MSDRKIVRQGDFYETEITQSVFQLSGASIAISNGVATVTLASHLLSTGALVTFSGVTGTGVTGLNNATWGPITVVNSGSYTFPCGLVGTPGGTIIQNGPLFFIPAGQWHCNLGANGQIEYDPGNLYGLNLSTPAVPNVTGPGGSAPTGLDTTWRILIAASGAGDFVCDGYNARFRPNGTTASSFFSRAA